MPQVPTAIGRLATMLGGDLLRASLLGTALPSLDGRYRIERVVGRGASGVVARAWDQRLMRHVALKMAPRSPESLAMLWLGTRWLGLGEDTALLQAYAFGLLFYSGMFNLFVVRERGPFWSSRPSRTMLLTVLADMLVVAVLLLAGIPGVRRLPPAAVGTLVGCSAICFLGINDVVKRLLLRWSGVTR